MSNQKSHWRPGRDEARQLRKAGYDGLYHPGECACEVDDLYPCGERHPDCRPGYKGPCTDDCEHEGAGEGNWHISPTKPLAPQPPDEGETPKP